jgi:hypothetical protein
MVSTRALAYFLQFCRDGTKYMVSRRELANFL